MNSNSPHISIVERELFLNISQYCEIVFDVGTRTDLIFHELSPNLTYHLFEPNPFFFSELMGKINDLPKGHKIAANCLALSTKTEKNINYYINSQSLVPNKFAPQSEKLADFQIETVSLPDYLKSKNLNKIDFLKLDTEGLDYLILSSNIESIKKLEVPFIQFEYWDGVRKFVDLLSDYDLYVLNEKDLSNFTGEKEKYITVDENLINKVDNIWYHRGWGGNVFAINKNWLSKNQAFKLNFGLL